MNDDRVKLLLQVVKNCDQNVWKDDGSLSLVKRILDGKVLVDRWGNITTNIVFNPKHKEFVHSRLSANKGYGRDSDGSSYIWGADISFSEEVPSDIVLLLNEEYDYTSIYSTDEEEIRDNQRKIALVPMIEHEEGTINSVKSNLQNIMGNILQVMKGLSSKDRVILGEQVNLLKTEIDKL